MIAERSGHNVLMGISDENETYITFQMTYKEAINALEIAHIRKRMSSSLERKDWILETTQGYEPTTAV